MATSSPFDFDDAEPEKQAAFDPQYRKANPGRDAVVEVHTRLPDGSTEVKQTTRDGQGKLKVARYRLDSQKRIKPSEPL